MAAATVQMSFEQFQEQYGQSDREYEFWFGEAIPKSMPTLLHGIIQSALIRLLSDAGYVSAPEVELRIVPDAHPKPDVIATRRAVDLDYPREGLEVVAEVVSKGDDFERVLEKCEKYNAWRFHHVFLVNAQSRTVYEFVDGSLLLREHIVEIPVFRLWAQVDRELEKMML